jgi:hypothetical protein
MPTTESNDEAAILVDGAIQATGDELSIGVLFGNLDGSNFAHQEPWRTQTFESWLTFMRAEWKASLSLGSVITMQDADGQETLRSTIGAGAPAAVV